MDQIVAEVEAALSQLYRGGALGVALSGGGDSMALTHIAAGWAARRGIPLLAATVDHGLRKGSAEEARRAAAAAGALDLDHETLEWTGWDGRGNLQAHARDARRDLLSDWARRRGLSAVLVGHTKDDQAETVLMRLGRGSGVDGLSAMTAESHAAEMRWLRPLLGQRRGALRDWLKARRVAWIDDPSNENDAFDRVRARHALSELGKLGVTVDGLAATAERLQSARAALDHATADLAGEAARWGACGELRLALNPLRAAPTELARRLLRGGLIRAAGAEYGPRADAELSLLSAMMSLKLGGGRSLHGCLIRPDGPTHVVVMREAASVDAAPRPAAEAPRLWDGRFSLMVDSAEGAVVAPLGERGARALSEMSASGAWSAPADWRAAPRGARLTTPALWRGDALAAAPLACWGAGMTAAFAPTGADWFDAA